MNKYFTELIGTFFLVLTIGLTVIAPSSGVMPPLAIGAILMAMIYAGGYLSGAHYNPAVTLGVMLRGRIDKAHVAPYMIAQTLGAIGAAFAVIFLKGSPAITPAVFVPARAVLAEFLFTFALVFTVLNVATTRATAGNSFYGVAIGLVVIAGAFSVGSISGAAFNPAVAVASAVMGLLSWTDLWIYFVGAFAGGAVAALAFNSIQRND